MATSLVANMQWCVSGWSGMNSGGHSLVENMKRGGKDGELGPAGTSVRWLGSKPAALRSREGWRSREGQRRPGTIPILSALGRDTPEEADNDDEERPPDSVNSELFRQRIENMLGNDARDAKFEGKDLAQLIRNKYGRSYDVRLIKKDFFGRQLLAMNIMWKYREQRSFPLTEEEYLLHLDYIAQSLRGWGAVGVVRDSLLKTRERPRTGKAVSIFINPDESGERSREWIKT